MATLILASGLHFLINDTCYFSNLFIIRTWHFGTLSKSEIEDSGLKCSMIGHTTEYEYEDRKNVVCLHNNQGFTWLRSCIRCCTALNSTSSCSTLSASSGSSGRTMLASIAWLTCTWTPGYLQSHSINMVTIVLERGRTITSRVLRRQNWSLAHLMKESLPMESAFKATPRPRLGRSR